MDEVVAVSKRLKTNDLQTSSVILDFAQQKVLQCSLNGVTIPKDWHKILTFYYQHYKNVLDRLAKENGLEIRQDHPAPDASPDTTPISN